MTRSNPDARAKRSKRWKMDKPEHAGIYWVRGYEWHNPISIALVEVAEHRGKLICNLHQSNSERDKEEWFTVSEMSNDLEWLEVAQ